MGDDRPAVYEDVHPDTGEEIVVYRASSVGRCSRALLHARVGRSRSPVPAKLQAAFDSSAELEGPIIDAFTDQYEILVHDRQRVVWIEVLPGVWIRGSIDGCNAQGLIEVKAFGDDYWEKWRRGGIQAFPEYVAQFAVYCAGLVSSGFPDIRGGWFVVGHKGPDGRLVTKDGVPEVRFEWVEFSRGQVAKARARVRRVEELYDRIRTDRVRAESELTCTMEWGCPYWTLHDDADVQGEIDPFANRICAEIAQLQAAEKAGKDKIEKLKARLDEHLTQLGKEKIRVITGSDTSTLVTLVAPTTKRSLDRAKLTAKLGDLAEFEKVSDVKGYVKITPSKTNNNQEK